MTFLAIGVNTNKEYAIARYKSDLVKQINLIYPSTSLNWQQDGHHVRVKRTKVLLEPIRIIQTNGVQIKTANPLVNRIIELEKRYGTIDKVPAQKLSELQKFADIYAKADKYAKESRTKSKNMTSQFQNKEYQRYLNQKLTKMHTEKMPLEDIADELNRDNYISFNGNRILSLSSLRNMLAYHGFDWKHKKRGRPVRKTVGQSI